MIEMIYNRWFWVGIAAITAIVVHRIFFSKDKTTELLEREYHDIINSDKHKVKGQYD